MSTANDVARWATVDPFAAFEALAAGNTAAYEAQSAGACHPNSTVPAKEPVTVFHTQLPVAISLRTLAHSLASRTRGTALDATLALLVAARYCRDGELAVTQAMTARLFVASYRVASKATHDGVVSAADFSAMAGIAPWELARLETTVLHGIGWAVHSAIGRTAETQEHGTASEAMLEDEAAERVAALINLQPAAAPTATEASEAAAVAAEQQVADRHANSISDMHPGGGPLEVSVAEGVHAAAAAQCDASRDAFAHDATSESSESSESSRYDVVA